jgi:hypothetical protein
MFGDKKMLRKIVVGVMLPITHAKESKNLNGKLVSLLLLLLVSTLTVALTAMLVSVESQGVVLACHDRLQIYEAGVFDDSVPNEMLNGVSSHSYYIRPQDATVSAGARIEMVTPFGDEYFPSINWNPSASFNMAPWDDGYRYEWVFSDPVSEQAAVWIQSNFSVEFEPKFACQRIWNPWITSESLTQKLTIKFTPSSGAQGVHIQARVQSTPEASVTIVPESNSSDPRLLHEEYWFESENGQEVANWAGDPVIGTPYTFSVDITVVNKFYPEAIYYKPSVGIGVGIDVLPEPELEITPDHVTIWDDVDGDGIDESSVTYSGTGDFGWEASVRSENSVTFPSYITCVRIVVDGDPSDWAGIPPIVTDPNDMSYDDVDLSEVYVTNDEDNLYIRMDVYGNISGAGGAYQVLMDLEPRNMTWDFQFGLISGWGYTQKMPSYESFPLNFSYSGSTVEMNVSLSDLDFPETMDLIFFCSPYDSGYSTSMYTIGSNNQTITVDGDPTDWTGSPFFMDDVGDAMAPGLDLQGCWIGDNGTDLFVMMNTSAILDPGANGQMLIGNYMFLDTKGKVVEFSTPLIEIGNPSNVYISGGIRSLTTHLDQGEATYTVATASCDVFPTETRLNESVTVSGYISPTAENVNVTLTYTKPDLTLLTRTVWTDSYGFYNDTFTPDNAGTWIVYASWQGDIDHYESSHVSFTVSKITTSISCFVSPEKTRLGENIIITGSTSPPLEDVNVTVTFTKPDSSTLIQTAPLVQGEYVYTYMPDSSGSWHIKASWLGNDNYEGANSSTRTFTVEFLVPVRKVPPPENTAVAVAVGASVTVGFTAFMGLSGFAQSFNKAISKLSVPDWLKDFLNLYAEKTFETLTSEEIKALKGKKMLTLRELLSLLLSAVVLLTVFVYVEVNGLPNFWNMEYLSAAVPQVLISVVLVFVSSQVFSIVNAKALSIWSEFKLWLYGLVALLVTGIIFKIPFASPRKMEYQGDLDRKRAGLIATSEILCIFILSIPFYLFYTLGFTTMGDAGLMVTMMTACYSSFPFKPLGGEAIFRYNKHLWVATFIPSFSIFICTILGLLPHAAYLVIGTATTLLFIGLILTLKKKRALTGY